MAIRVKCYPAVDYLYAFLSTKDVLITNKHPQVLHYTGDDVKELKKIVKKDKPDLLINHSFPSFDTVDVFQVYHPLKSQADLMTVKKIVTNRFMITKHYYGLLGLQVEIVIKSSKRKGLPKLIGIKSIDKVNRAVCSFISKFYQFMHWD